MISAVGHETDFHHRRLCLPICARPPPRGRRDWAAHEAQLCSLLDRLSLNLARSINFRITGARNQVQELALSPAFDAVNAAILHSAMLPPMTPNHRLQTPAPVLSNGRSAGSARAAHSLSPESFART